MATIAINFNSGGVNWDNMSPGAGLKQAFSDAVKSAGTLKNSLKTLKTQISNIKSVAEVTTSEKKAAAAEEREIKKQGALSFAYNKIEEYMGKVVNIDLAAAAEIRQLKKNFYSNYSYLKPECEKTGGEKFRDAVKGAWEGLKNLFADIGTAIRDFVVGVYEWCKKHWVELVVGTLVIVVGAVISVFLSPAAGVAFWQAVGTAIFKGLIAAGISAGVSGSINFGIGYYQSKKAGLSDKQAFRNAMYAFGEGAASGYLTGAISFGVGSVINSSATVLVGKTNLLVGHSYIGSIGKGMMFGAVTNSTTSVITTEITYYMEHGTLDGAGAELEKSFWTGMISGAIIGGIFAGRQYKIQEKLDTSFNEENLARTQRGDQSANRSNGMGENGERLANQGDNYGDYMKGRLEETYQNNKISEEISINNADIDGKTRIDYTISDSKGKIIKGVEAKSSDTAPYQKGQLNYFANNDGKLVADADVVGKKSLSQVGGQTVKAGTEIVTIRPSNFTEEIGVRLDRVFAPGSYFGQNKGIGEFTRYNFLDVLDQVKGQPNAFLFDYAGSRIDLGALQTVVNIGTTQVK